MTNTFELRDLALHMAWADAVAWRAVLGSPVGTEDERIRFLLHHIHTAQRAFLQLWRGQQPTVVPLDDFADLRSIAQWARVGHDELSTWLSAATPDTLERRLAVPPPPQLEQPSPFNEPTLAHTVVQVATHSAHHRGQISARLRQLGGEPSYTDFIVWVWSAQPPADWSFLSVGDQTPNPSAMDSPVKGLQ